MFLGDETVLYLFDFRFKYTSLMLNKEYNGVLDLRI